MKALQTFALGMVSGAVLIYVLLWRFHALAPPDLRLGPPVTTSVPARPAAVAPGVPEPARDAPSPLAAITPSALPSRMPGESTDDWIPSDPLAARPDLVSRPAPVPGDLSRLQQRNLAFPVSGYDRHQMRDNFAEMRGTRVHEALDLLAPRGTPVLAVDDGPVAKLFTSRFGGLTVYQFDLEGLYCYYYAHLDRYADGLKDGQVLKRGETIGYVGTTGNAPPNVPHLHFTIVKLGPDKHWWEGVSINPFPLWALR